MLSALITPLAQSPAVAVLSLGLVVVLVRVAAGDLARRLIENHDVALIFGLAVALALLRAGPGPGALDALRALAFVVPVAVGLFALGLWGGGDAKLVMALAPLAPGLSLVLLVLLIVLAGFGLALVWLVLRGLGRVDATAGLPYGVAIALGAGAFLGLDLFVFA